MNKTCETCKWHEYITKRNRRVLYMNVKMNSYGAAEIRLIDILTHMGFPEYIPECSRVEITLTIKDGTEIKQTCEFIEQICK